MYLAEIFYARGRGHVVVRFPRSHALPAHAGIELLRHDRDGPGCHFNAVRTAVHYALAHASPETGARIGLAHIRQMATYDELNELPKRRRMVNCSTSTSAASSAAAPAFPWPWPTPTTSKRSTPRAATTSATKRCPHFPQRPTWRCIAPTLLRTGAVSNI